MRLGHCLKLSLLLALLNAFLITGVWAKAKPVYPDLSKTKELVIKRGYSKEALQCIECHAKKTPGIVEDWKNSRMAHAGVSCYDCHVVPKSSPMASQCEGIRGSKIFTSPIVSPKTCARCHPTEVEEFEKSAHATLASRPVVEKLVKLWHDLEGGVFAGMDPNSPVTSAPRQSGCQACHGGEVKLGPDHKPTKDSWPGGIGHRYPDGGVGNCTVCHNRHAFSIAQARKPEACGKCHLGPDHPNMEIYYESAHGQKFLTEGEKWNWDAAPDTWEPGDYTAPTCATCHMSGIGDLKTTHNITERLKWDLVHKKSVIRSGERGDGERGRQLMRKVCLNCHSKLFVDAHFNKLDNSVALYNFYWDKTAAMLNDLKAKGLLKKDKWSDPIQELAYYLWHHNGRRARQGAAMAGPDYAHWHGFFQMFQIYKDIQAIYNYRIKNKKIEELSPVMSTGPY